MTINEHMYDNGARSSAKLSRDTHQGVDDDGDKLAAPTPCTLIQWLRFESLVKLSLPLLFFTNARTGVKKEVDNKMMARQSMEA